MPQYTLQELATLLDATVSGDSRLMIEDVVHPFDAKGPQHLALILDPKIIAKLQDKPPATALVPQDLITNQIPNQLQVKRPRLAIAKLLALYEKPVHIPPGVHASAVIDPTVTLAPDVIVGPLCTVGPNTTIAAGTRLVSGVHIGADAVVGENCLLFPGVYVGDRVRLGNRVIIQPNANIGGDGFSYVTPEPGSVEAVHSSGAVSSQNTEIIRINSIGTVVLEDDVEIGSGACVDRATVGETRIGRGTKVDNMVQIAHNITIGQNCLFAGQAGLAGSIVVGDRVVIGGQAGLRDHISIGNDAVIAARSGVVSDVDPKTILIGCHARPRKEFLQYEMQLKRATALPQRVKTLTEKVDALTQQLETVPAAVEAEPV